MQSTHPVLPSLPLAWLARASFCLALLLAALLADPRFVRAQAGDYDLTVVLVGVSPGPTHLAASYSHPVAHAALRAALAGLARDVGRPVEGMVLQDAPLYPGARVVSTAAEITSPGLVVSGAPLPVAAVMRTFPGWRHLRVAFITGPGFRFAGPGDGGGFAGYRVRLITGPSSYEYDVERTAAGGPPRSTAVPPDARAAPPARKARPLLGGTLLLVVILSLGALVVVGLRVRSPRRAK